METAEGWELALPKPRTALGPGAVAAEPAGAARRAHTAKICRRAGGYCLREPDGERDVTLIATGSEVAIAVAGGGALLAAKGIAAAVVSMPCFELFEAPGRAATARRVLGTAPRVGVEAAVRAGLGPLAAASDGASSA